MVLATFHVIPAIQRIAPLFRRLSAHVAEERLALHVLRFTNPGQIKEGGSEIDVGDKIRIHAAGFDERRAFGDKRHFKRLFHDEAFVVKPVVAKKEPLI